MLVLYIVIAVLVLVRVISRQITGSRLTVGNLVFLPGILVVLGIAEALPVLNAASGTEVLLLGADLLVLILLGAARAASTTITSRDGFAFQHGTALTTVLWVATIAVRAGFLLLATDLGAAGPLTSIMLTLGLSLGVQNAFVYTRARRLGFTIPVRQETQHVRR
jgi:hypothetical protein